MYDFKFLLKLKKLTKEQYDLWEERAAIMEYDGGLKREDAEVKAYNLLFEYL
jgi:hypothetical protein